MLGKPGTYRYVCREEKRYTYNTHTHTHAKDLFLLSSFTGRQAIDKETKIQPQRIIFPYKMYLELQFQAQY